MVNVNIYLRILTLMLTATAISLLCLMRKCLLTPFQRWFVFFVNKISFTLDIESAAPIGNMCKDVSPLRIALDGTL